jgi:hypothetical protein
MATRFITTTVARQTVHIYPPAGTTFGGLTDGACIDTVKVSVYDKSGFVL